MTAFLISILNKKGVEINLQKIEREIKDKKLREEVIAELGGVFAVHLKYNLLSIGVPFTNNFGPLASNYYLESYVKTRLKRLIRF